jgi:DNA-binding transcriptional regulator YhcF (GntR family)
LIIKVDPASALPPYEQIRLQIADMAAAGVLAPGMQLPTIRQLAGDLGVAAGTVQRAYRELERDNVVISRVRHGTTIASGVRRDRRLTQDRLAESARAFAVVARGLGATREQAVQALDEQLSALEWQT